MELLPCLLSLFILQTCLAQQPPRPPPKISESFLAYVMILKSGEVEFKDGQEYWARSVDEKKIMVEEALEFRTYTVVRQHIRLFNKLIEYNISLDDDSHVLNCTSSKISEDAKFPSFWGWLEGAKFELYFEKGTNKTYSSWKLKTHTGSLQLVVIDPDVEPVFPYLLIEVTGSDVVERVFGLFSPGTPSDDYFAVPPECPATLI